VLLSLWHYNYWKFVTLTFKILAMDYKAIKIACKENDELITNLVDKFLIYYAAAHNKLEVEMERSFDTYNHVALTHNEEWIKRSKAQFLAHRIFKKGGLVKSFLKHPTLKSLTINESRYLEFQTENPWRFSFSIIKKRRAANFFLMEDVFSNEEFLLYSPSVEILQKEQPVVLWFNLITYNGYCWQTYGVVSHFKSFEPDDIFFFATELNPAISNDAEILKNIEQNPVPYMMLYLGSEDPMIFNHYDQLVNLTAEYELDSMNTKKLTKNFKSEYNNGVYRLSLKTWHKPPHFAQVFFDENKGLVLLSAMTDRGFDALVSALNGFGFDFSKEPFIRVNISMLNVASEILKKKIRLIEYEDMFSKKTSVSDQKNLEKIDLMLRSVLPDINANREIDIEQIADAAGVDIRIARKLINDLKRAREGGSMA
jgi:hypothetical protein